MGNDLYDNPILARIAKMDLNIRSRKHVPQQTEEYLRLFYGSCQTLPMRQQDQKIPTPRTTISQAGKFVMKQQEKGFVKLDPSISSPRQVYSRNLQTWSNKTEVKKPVKQRTITVLPYQKFWLTTGIVERTAKEVGELKFLTDYDQEDAVPKFMERAATITVTMNTLGMLDMKKKGRKELQRVMNWFYKEIQQLRVDMMTNWLKAGKLMWSELTEEQRSEFAEFKPVESRPSEPVDSPPRPDPRDQKHEDSLDDKLIDSIARSVNLPSTYRPSSSSLSRHARAVINRQNQRVISEAHQLILNKLNRPSTAVPQHNDIVLETQRSLPVTRKQPVRILSEKRALNTTRKEGTKRILTPKKKPMTKDEITSIFWDVDDPLCTSRKRGTNALEMMREYSSSIDYEVPELEEVDPDVIFGRNKPESEHLSKPGTSRVDLRMPQSSRDQNNTAEGEANQPQQAQVWVSHYSVKPSDPKDMAFLIQQSEDVIGGMEGKEMYTRMTSVWDDLGFSINQKLDMAVKYTGDSDDCSKLTGVVDMWENAYQTVLTYDKAYREMKDFIRIESSLLDNKSVVLLENLKNDLDIAERNIEDVCHTLKHTYGDDLVMKRKKALDLIQVRRGKIQILLQQSGLANQLDKSSATHHGS